MKDQREESAWTANQEGRSIWVQLEESERFVNIICWSIIEMQEDF
jgi:hypothetical protein